MVAAISRVIYLALVAEYKERVSEYFLRQDTENKENTSFLQQSVGLFSRLL